MQGLKSINILLSKTPILKHGFGWCH